METGTLNLDAKSLDEVFALASGNSIYMLQHIVTDSVVVLPRATVVLIVGNVVGAGISLLVPPTSRPLMRPLSSLLRAVMYADFDGKRENNFASTSLHLSFTPHEFPLEYGVIGIIDHQVFFVESVISVHDSGKWVVDLDILRPLQDGARKTPRFPSAERSQVKRSHEHSEESVKAAIGSFVSIYTWEEVLDGPPTHALVRARDNGAARLAVLSVILQNADRGPKFASDDDEDDAADEASAEEDLEQGQSTDMHSGNISSCRQDQVRVSILQSREEVCWVCVHERLAKMGWLEFQDLCFIVT